MPEIITINFNPTYQDFEYDGEIITDLTGFISDALNNNKVVQISPTKDTQC